MTIKPSERRVVMAKVVAREWLRSRATPEYRFKILHNQDLAVYANLLRGFRDSKTRVAGIPPIPDLGVREEVGGLTLWAADWKGLKALKDFFEKKGMDTSWIWTKEE